MLVRLLKLDYLAPGSNGIFVESAHQMLGELLTRQQVGGSLVEPYSVLPLGLEWSTIALKEHLGVVNVAVTQ